MSPPTEGIIAALWTPADKQGHLHTDALRTNIEFLRRKRVHGILALGSTGEFLQFEVAARKQILETIVDFADGLPVIANISDVRPAAVADLARHSRDVGAAGVAILPPFFYPVDQSDLAEFFVLAGKAAKLPTYLYNFPERTGNRIELETISAVAQRLPLVAVKQSGDDFDYHLSLVKLGQQKSFAVLTGADTRLAEAMALGVTGCVSGLSNAVPELMTEIFDAMKEGSPKLALRATERMQEIGRAISQVPFPFNVSAAIEARGLAPGHPKTVVSASTGARYKQLVRDLKKRFREWKLI